jgi:hypothetical protein
MTMLTAIVAYSQSCSPRQGTRKGYPAWGYMTMSIEVEQ